MHFIKMHGLGNDYLYVYGAVPPDVSDISRRLSDRHFGPGSDGMIYISPSDRADYSMRIFNADGSEAMMCGNGIRCVGRYVHDLGYTDKTELDIETLSGIKHLSLQLAGDRVSAVTVDMGTAECSPPASIDAGGREYVYTGVSVGNPHAVIFTDDAEAVPLETVGPLIEHHPAFPGGVNAEFVQVTGPDRLRMRVWERGSGITLACGTGACASAAAAAAAGYCRYGEPVTVQLDGGELTVTVSPEGRVVMSGPAEFVCEGDTWDDKA